MSDLFQGQTMTHRFDFISAGTAHTFTFDFQPDKVVFYNLTKWGTTSAFPISTWFRSLTSSGDAYQQKVIVDNGATATANFILEATNGFTVADTSGGVSNSVFNIDAISATDPCVVSTDGAHGFQTNQIVRFTDLGQVTSALNRGMGQLNNNRYKIVVIDADEFSLKDVITGEPVNALEYTAYISGGKVTLETHVNALNFPQVSPYSNLNPYNPNPYAYDPVTYKLTAGTAVMGADGDQFVIELIKYGQVTDLGDLLT